MQNFRDQGVPRAPRAASTKTMGDEAEAKVLRHLQQAGLRLVARNFRSPGRGGGEIDLIMREPDGTLVFVEVRQRSRARHGEAADTVDWRKRRRIVFAARHFLLDWGAEPPCRFDVVAWDGALDDDAATALRWIRAAFDASG